MARKFSQGTPTKSTRNSTLPAHKARGMDVGLGMDLMSDGKVPRIYKLRAFVMGGAIVAIVLALAALLARAAGLRGTGIPTVSACIYVLAGSLLIGVALLPFAAPGREVSRLKWRRYSAIPLRPSTTGKLNGKGQSGNSQDSAPEHAVVATRTADEEKAGKS